MILDLDNIIGLSAGAAMIIAFCCKHMVWLRAAAIIANLLFITYALRLGLMPVLLLHCVLLPLNILRLITFIQTAPKSAVTGRSGQEARPPGNLGLQPSSPMPCISRRLP